jgi:nitrate reductase NapE component
MSFPSQCVSMLLPTEEKSKEFNILFLLLVCFYPTAIRQTDWLTERQTGIQVKSKCYSKFFWNLRLQSRSIGTFSCAKIDMKELFGTITCKLLLAFLLLKFCIMMLCCVTVTGARGLVVACVCFYLTCMKRERDQNSDHRNRVFVCITIRFKLLQLENSRCFPGNTTIFIVFK